VGAISATNLPVLRLAVPAGVLGDLFDREPLVARPTLGLGSGGYGLLLGCVGIGAVLGATSSPAIRRRLDPRAPIAACAAAIAAAGVVLAVSRVAVLDGVAMVLAGTGRIVSLAPAGGDRRPARSRDAPGRAPLRGGATRQIAPRVARR